MSPACHAIRHTRKNAVMEPSITFMTNSAPRLDQLQWLKAGGPP
jgi:hypothetical protein